MSIKDLAWISGLFEGEGYIRSKRNGLGVNMTDLDVLEKFLSIVQVGTIRPSKVYRKHYKPLWVWTVWHRRDVYYLLESMLPFFGERRSYDALNRLDAIDKC